MNIRPNTKTSAVLRELRIFGPEPTCDVAFYGYKDGSKTGQSSTRRVLSQFRRAGLAKKTKDGWTATAKGRKISVKLSSN